MSERLTDEQFEAIQAAHPGVRLRRVMGPAGELVIRAPTANEEATFQAMLFGPSMHAGMAQRNLLVMLVVHPDKLKFQAMLADWPGMSLNPTIIREMRIIRGEVNEEEGK
jgi:hypothetical protein